MALGACAAGQGAWRLEALDRVFLVDIDARRLRTADEPDLPVDVRWTILVLHYLLAPVPAPPPVGVISFEEIPSARGYAGPYRGRVIGRFLATAGRDRATLSEAARALGGRPEPQEAGGLAFRFLMFPLVPVTVVWYEGDDELPPGAGFLYAGNVASILEVEDIVVMSERLVSRLDGKPW